MRWMEQKRFEAYGVTSVVEVLVVIEERAPALTRAPFVA